MLTLFVATLLIGAALVLIVGAAMNKAPLWLGVLFLALAFILNSVARSRWVLGLLLVLTAVGCSAPSGARARADPLPLAVHAALLETFKPAMPFQEHPVRIDTSRDQMLHRAQELAGLGIVSRRVIPDRSRVPELFSSAQVVGEAPTYPFELLITTPPGSSHPGTFPAPIDGGNLLHRFKVRLEMLQVGNWLEPYYVIYAEHGPGVFTVVSGDTNDTDFVGLPQ